MPQAIGIKGYAQFAREATWATAVAATHRIGFEECTLNAEPGIAESKMMVAGTLGGVGWMDDAANAGIEVVGNRAAGRLVMPMDYNGLLQFIDMIMGTATYGSYGAAVTGGGPYTHTWALEREFLNSMTIQLGEGGVNVSTAGKYLGMKAVGLNLSCKAGLGDAGIARLAVDFVGQQRSADATPTAGQTAIARLPIYFSHLSASDNGLSTTPVWDSLELDIRPTIAAVPGMGSAYIQEPLRAGKIAVTLKIVQRFIGNSALVAYQAGTLITGAPSFTFSSGSYSFAVVLNKSKIITRPAPVFGLGGLMMEEVTYKAMLSDVAVGGLTIVAVSAQNGAAA